MDGRDKKTILLVEDEALIALSEKLSLENYGYDIIVAHTGEKAVEAVKSSRRIDLILMDIDLGEGIDGTQAAEIILRDHDIPIVFVSSHSEREIVEKTEKITSYGYIVKNSSVTVLDASIKMAFRLFDAFRNEKAKEKALEKSEKMFAAAFDQNPMSIQILDKAGYTLKVNPAFTLLFGSAPPEGYSLFDDAQLAQPGMKEIMDGLKGGRNIRFPEVFFNAHGSIPELPDKPVWVRTIGFPLNGTDEKPEKYVLMHENVTSSKLAMEESKKHLFEVKFLSESAIEYMENGPDNNIYEYIAKKLAVLLPNYRIIVNEYSETEEVATVMALEGGDDIIASAVRIIGRNIIGMRTPLIHEEKEKFKNRGIIAGPESVRGLVGGLIPDFICRSLDTLLNFGKIYGIGFSSEDSLFGNVVLISPKGVLLKDTAIIESFIGQSTVAIQKYRAEKRIKTLLMEKTTLLNEVHHRIKNNIASIEGLLSMQLESIGNPEAVSALQDAIGRVGSMRILYDKLLFSDDYGDISVKEYLESVVDTVLSLFPDNSRISCETNIDDFLLSSRILSALGIIVNEILTNIMKYAFQGRDSGLICLSLNKAKNHVTLAIQDNGRGLPKDFNFQESKGFGLRLVGMLSEQLKANFTIADQKGTKTILEFDI